MRKWIWSSSEAYINKRACFAGKFKVDSKESPVILSICAVSRYRVWLNGRLVGSGPVRSGKGERFFDHYDVSAFLVGDLPDRQNIAIEVWSYGLSNYQNIAERPALCFSVIQNGRELLVSDEKIKAADDLGVLSDMPKRNVNLGFTDYYDGRKWDAAWFRKPKLWERFSNATVIQEPAINAWKCAERDIRILQTLDQYPRYIEAIQDVKKGCQVYTVNVRNTLFPGRIDADETSMAVVIGTVLASPKEMDGEISFPNRTWNGIIGSFSIDGKWHPVTDNTRDCIPVHLSKGLHLFLIFAKGTFDDLYCHIELSFPEPVQIVPIDFSTKKRSRFFTIGPIQKLVHYMDGVDHGQADILSDEVLKKNPIWEGLLHCRNESDLCNLCGNSILFVPEEDVCEDAYLLSLVRKEKVVADYVIREENQGILWNNLLTTVINPPVEGDYRRVIVDFGTILAGRLYVTLKAKAGTILDFYAFENNYHREIDYTIGLNNGARYITRDGWQTFAGMARMGVRYLVITVRNAMGPVEIQDLHIESETYSVTNAGRFECSDSLLNRIFEMCRDTNLLCTEDSFTDCPTYEQSFWIGDACISSKVNTMLYGDFDYQLHNERLAISALSNTKIMNALTPTDWNTSIPMWAFDWIQSVFDTADASGEENCIDQFYDKLSEVLKNYAFFVSPENGFWICADNLIDWANMDVPKEGCITGQEGMLAWCFGKAAEYAEKTGRSEDAKLFSHEKSVLYHHINTVLWDDKRKAYSDCWTKKHGLSKVHSLQTHLLLYYTDMVSDERKNLIREYIIHPPEDFVRVGSPFMLFYLYEICIRLGNKQYVAENIKDRWGKMLFYDSTTCWEVFPGFYEENRTRSYCHSWSSSPAYFMLRYMTGIDFLNQDGSKIAVGALPEFLSWCRAELPTKYGRIRIYWHKEKNEQKTEVLLYVPEKTEVVTDNSVNVIMRRLKEMP